ncbi:MAG: FtsX-like permease family protein [Nocardioides sp.]
MTFVSGWRLALRMAWREAWRAKGRTLLVLVMVTFPVVAVVAADIAQATSSVSSVEGLDRRIGSAQAELSILPGVGAVFQTADPDSGGFGTEGSPDGTSSTPSLADVEKALGGGARSAIPLVDGAADVTTKLGTLRVNGTGVDMSSPLAKGLFRLTSGRYPRATGEVAINAALAGHGYAVGDRIDLVNGTSATVVGIAESTGQRTSPLLLGMPSLFPPSGQDGVQNWLVGGAPVTWSQVRAVNALGVTVLSRAVIEHPPSTSQLPRQVRQGLGQSDSTVYAVLALIGVMALIEVVLLAGPAFAVGARRQSRSLALIAANGGTPTQSRRVVLGSAMVVGAVAAVAGVALGIGLGRALLPPLQSMSSTYFGPFQIRWEHVLGIAAFGLVSAVLAAVVPAWIASRQDVVAVLAGRRGDRAASRRSPFIGLALVAVGILAAVAGARQGSGEGLIAVAAICSVFGMIFLVPMVVLGVARLGRRLPLPLRYAVRDAARHRTRTVPAVAAVAATVAGVVALSIGNTSDQAQAKAEYTPQLPQGYSSIAMGGGHTDWDTVEAAVSRVAPAARVTRALGVRGSRPLMPRVSPGVQLPDTFVSSLPIQALVSDGRTVPKLVAQSLPPSEWARASAALKRGEVVLFGIHDGVDPHARMVLGGRHGTSVRVPATIVGVGTTEPSVLGILSPEVARSLHMRVGPQGLVLSGTTLTSSQSDDLQQVLTGMDQGAYLYTERGYQVSNAEKVVLWILFGLAAVLMLGGTLTATFLALSDARPDLATLSAVGASPVTRRAVAAAYAVSVGVVGAALGAAVGFVPGIAISYPLTRGYNPGSPSHYLSIPWVEIVGLVVALPVLTAVVVGVMARSRLPLVARLD